MARIKPVILCGGGGTRLWPLSDERAPKQFLSISGSASMLAETAERVADRSLFSNPLAIGSVRHASKLRAELPDADLLLEPVGRNSAPAIAAASLLADPSELLLVLPADHYIAFPDRLVGAVVQATAHAHAGQIVTFGIEPEFPATGYGYIEAEPSDDGVKPVARFVEKPDRERAEAYIATGRFYWNAGIFLFRAETMRAALEAHAPDILSSVQSALDPETGLNQAAFARCRSESIDYAVLEHADSVSVVPVSMGWSDLGDHKALYDLRTADDAGVVVQGPGAVERSERVLVHSEGPTVALHNLSGVGVIATRDAVLVTDLDTAADVRGAVEAAKRLRSGGLPAHHAHRFGSWLYQDVLPGWLELARDTTSGGFVEALDLEGRPLAGLPRRGRVAPRQVFSFARALRQGWDPGGRVAALIEHGVQVLTGPARSSKGGWAHMLGPDGRATDHRRDLYDHAFIALCGAELTAAGQPAGAELADEAFALIDQEFRVGGEGWRDTETGDDRRLSNPHMHLLEASLAHYEATASQASRDRIEEICLLFERRMFDPELGAVREEYGPDWASIEGSRIEPGHCYEWAFLLVEAERLTGRDLSSWARRLVEFAERRGVRDGLVVNEIDHTHIRNSDARLWPQLERMRALSAIGRLDARLDATLEVVWNHYLSGGPQHGWADCIDEQHRPLSQAVPASMLYHLMTAFGRFAP